MFALECTLNKKLPAPVWDLVSGLLYQFHSAGIDEGEEPPPEGENALVAANEFESALEPGILSPPQSFIAYFENQRDADRAQTAIELPLEPFKPSFKVREVEEKNYAEIWKENFKPILTPPFWRIRAPWHNKSTKKGIIELVIEPGMAFGTGSHETTRGCLELIANACSAAGLKPRSKAAREAKVLDFGCGSGILAIGLKKLGVGHVYGIDIDPLSIDASRQNATLNRTKFAVSLSVGKLPSMNGIVANILKNTLLEFAPSFHRWLKPKGFLILSGLLVEQEKTILVPYEKLGFQFIKRIENNGWVSLWLSRSP